MLGLKQEDLAEMAGVSLATIKDIDRGAGNPSLRILEKIVERIWKAFLFSIYKSRDDVIYYKSFEYEK